MIVLGPNNFPFAYNGIAGGDFAAALAAGNPVIAKAHPAHPRTTQLLAEAALSALRSSGVAPAAVQLFYHTAPELGLRLVAARETAARARALGMEIAAFDPTWLRTMSRGRAWNGSTWTACSRATAA